MNEAGAETSIRLCFKRLGDLEKSKSKQAKPTPLRAPLGIYFERTEEEKNQKSLLKSSLYIFWSRLCEAH